MEKIMRKAAEYKEKLSFDTTKLDSVSRLENMGWSGTTDIKKGLDKTCVWRLSKGK